jgi:hypothetical protein
LVYEWVHRFNESGFTTFEQPPNPKGRLPIITGPQIRELIRHRLVQSRRAGAAVASAAARSWPCCPAWEQRMRATPLFWPNQVGSALDALKPMAWRNHAAGDFQKQHSFSLLSSNS